MQLFGCKKKAMATHSSTLAWGIPGTGETGGLPSMGSYIVGHNWRDSAAAAAALGVCVWSPEDCSEARDSNLAGYILMGFFLYSCHLECTICRTFLILSLKNIFIISSILRDYDEQERPGQKLGKLHICISGLRKKKGNRKQEEISTKSTAGGGIYSVTYLLDTVLNALVGDNYY